ncbi:MAG: hypothetical protein R3176_10155, partial [Woeseiaceae bacterium]|nr:hypothetical protein [Woeseiaceae bacterium]
MRPTAVKTWLKCLAPAAIAATACSGSGTGPGTAAGDAPGSAAAADDLRVAERLYDPGYSAPAGFYVDARATTERSYTIHHVLDPSNSFERCTDDYAVARAWEAEDNAARQVQGYYVESADTERYFEFARELSYDSDVGNIDDITSPGFARVFKCSNTNRDGVDRNVLDGYAGTLNARPLAPEKVREFTEYLWQFAFFPASRRKVLDSYGTGTAEQLITDELFGSVTSISPDGELAFGSLNPSGTDNDIGIFELQGERSTTVFLKTSFDEGNPVISPDGRWVAYLSTESGR